ncbi:hypothetical protein [Paucisalibacillus globulus]|uniref:hypothetical protein n=1 Tax=Paucisalibacillus globulus TaxID=351095 RepID=UPI0004166BE6|nr:hypothetical protein [Paucisalibacillus globulus]
MRKYIRIILVSFLFLYGCSESDIIEKDNQGTNEENEKGNNIEMNGIDIYDFYYLNKAPAAEQKHSLDDVIKVFFSEWSMTGGNTMAIDIENGEIYKEPRWTKLGVDSLEKPVKVEDVNQVIEVLQKYEVQDWKTDYTFEDPSTYEDGYSWRLWLQFKDGTVEKHSGEGTEKEKLTPEEFEYFVDELIKYVDERL